MKITKKSLFVLLVLILGVFLIFGPTLLDYVGNHEMYNYGLEFNWAWFIPWVIGLHITVGASSVSNAVLYWWARGQTKRSRLTAFLVGLTSYWQLISGNEDFIWFVVFDGGLPPMDKVWWWMPQDWIVQLLNPSWRWTTFHEICWIVIFNAILLGIWAIWYVRNIKNNHNT